MSSPHAHITKLTASIQLRIFFRIVEYAQGLDSPIPNHEVYQYTLDSLPMLVALVLFNIFHPGRIMPGKVSNIPSRKERKRLLEMQSGDYSSDGTVKV